MCMCEVVCEGQSGADTDGPVAVSGCVCTCTDMCPCGPCCQAQGGGYGGALWTIGICNPGMCTSVCTGRGVCVESCVLWWKLSSQETCMHLDLFSLTKFTAAAVVVWWGVQDRQTHNQGGIPVAELGVREAQAEDTSPTLPEPDILGPCPRPAHPRIGRIQPHPGKPSPAPPPPPSHELGEGATRRNRP